ncbi:MAG: thioesterase family protein [Dermabacter sp.]|nr:thioesterase family protein [Dermabacter sp.]
MAHLDIPIPIRWTDLDGYQHVNNTTFLRLLEEARIQAFWAPSAAQQELGAIAYPTAVPEISPDGPFRTFVASNRIEYLRQLGYRRDGVIVRLWLSKVGRASLDVDYEILTRDEMDSPYAKARSVLVLIDATTGAPTRIPDSLREGLDPFTDEPLSFRG